MPTTKTKDEPKADSALKTKVLRIEFARHNLDSFSEPRRSEKAKKLEGFVDRAIRDGLTLKMVDENIALGRPPHFIEGEHPSETGA